MESSAYNIVNDHSSATRVILTLLWTLQAHALGALAAVCLASTEKWYLRKNVDASKEKDA